MSSPPTAQPAEPSAQFSVTDVRRLWPEVLEEVKRKRRFTWILLSQNAHVVDVRGGSLLLAMPNVGARDSFAKGGSEDVLREAIVVVLGADFKIEAIVDPAVSGGAPGPARERPADRPVPSPGPATTAPEPADPPPGPGAASPRAPAAVTQQARNGIRTTRMGARTKEPVDDRDAAAAPDDSDLDEGAESHAELLARHLGAEIIAEENHDA